MSSWIDSGARCDDHAGEVFPPRCRACDAAAEATDPPPPPPRVYVPGSSCPLHPHYPEPCDACDREATDLTNS